MNVEEAYKAIAMRIIASAGGAEWDHACEELNIYDRMASSVLWFHLGDNKFQGDGSPPIDVARNGLNAVLYLRDNLLESTKQRIYGLTFTLYRTGKFNIEYSYDKPDGYDD